MLHNPAGFNGFGTIVPSWGTTRPSANFGTSVTPSTSGYGSWASLGSALGSDAYGILININTNVGAGGASRETVIKIGVDTAGGTTYTDAITGLICGNAPAYSSNAAGYWYYFPLFIKSGSTLAVAGYSTVTDVFYVNCETYHRPSDSTLINYGSFVETIGITGTSGVNVTQGTTSEGSWVSIGTTAKRCWWWQVGIAMPSSDTTHNAAVIHFDLAVGNATNKDIIISDGVSITTGGEANMTVLTAIESQRSVPAGSTMYIRCQSSSTSEVMEAAVYGLG